MPKYHVWGILMEKLESKCQLNTYRTTILLQELQKQFCKFILQFLQQL